jgi:hypothetical protein
VKSVTQQPAASNSTADGIPGLASVIVPTDCQDCDGMGYHEEDSEQLCASCRGTGEHCGIPDAYGQLGVTAVYVDLDAQDTSTEPRKLVHLETFTCETALTLEGTEQLASRLHSAVYDVRREEKERAFTNALASGERSLESVREQLGERAINCLAREGVLTIERAAAMTDAELLAIVNLGLGTLERIRAVVGHGCRPGQPGGGDR